MAGPVTFGQRGGTGGGGGGSPTGPAGGDLSGTYPNPSVVDDSHNHTATTLPATIVYDGDTAGGDLSGTYPNPTVVSINGVSISGDPFTQYTKLAGRTGTTNNTVLSSSADGTLTGSTVVGGTLNLKPNAVNTGNTYIAVQGGGLSLLNPTGTLPPVLRFFGGPSSAVVTSFRCNTSQAIDIDYTFPVVYPSSDSVLVSDLTGQWAWADYASLLVFLSHDLLSVTHGDTVIGTVVKGDLIVGNSTPRWERLPVGATNGHVLTIDSTVTQGVKWAASSGGPPSGAAGGDLTGTYPNPTVRRVQGEDFISPLSPSGGRLIIGNGSAWASQPVSGDATLTLTGALTLASVLTAGGPTGSATVVPVITWDAKGRLTAVTTATIVGPFPATAHDLLSATHGDTLAASPPTRGDLIVANSTSVWARFAIGLSNRLLQSNGTDPAWVVMTGDATIAVGGALSLVNVNSNTGTFGNASQVGSFDVNAKGLITAASSVNIAIAVSQITSGQAALTRVNDTNVTLTLGGSPTVALLAATSLTLGWTGTLGLARGGTAVDLSATGGTSQVLKQVSAGAAVTVGQLAFTDISGSVTDAQVPDTITLTNITQITNRSHASLQNLVAPADDHTQYLLRSGRTGSTNDAIISSTASGMIAGSGVTAGNLTIEANNVDQTGQVTIDSLTEIWPSVPDITAVGTTNMLIIAPTVSLNAGGFVTTRLNMIGMAGTITFNSFANIFQGISFAPAVSVTGGAINSIQLMDASIVVTCAASQAVTTGVTFLNQPTFQAASNTTAGSSGSAMIGYYDNQLHTHQGTTGTYTTGVVTSFQSRPRLQTTDQGGTPHAGVATMTIRRGLWVQTMGIAGDGTENVTENIAVDIEVLTGSAVTGNNISIRSRNASIHTYAVTSFTIPTGFYCIFGELMALFGSDFITAEGTATLTGI